MPLVAQMEREHLLNDKPDRRKKSTKVWLKGNVDSDGRTGVFLW